jgi:hypothetical protein
MCNLYCSYIKRFIDKFQDPLFAIVEPNFDIFLKNLPTDARTCLNKAKRNGYEFDKIQLIDVLVNKDILEIYNSKSHRQNREINYLYEHIISDTRKDVREYWPVPDYSIFSCNNHKIDFWVCKKDKKVVAFLELLHSNELTTVRATMGHANHLKYGIMKALILQAIKIDNIKYLHYGEYRYTLNDSRAHFMKDLGIIHHNSQQLLRQESYI